MLLPRGINYEHRAYNYSRDSDRNHQHSLNAPSIQSTSGSSQGVTNATDCDYVPSLIATAGPQHEYTMNSQLEVISSIGTYSEDLENFPGENQNMPDTSSTSWLTFRFDRAETGGDHTATLTLYLPDPEVTQVNDVQSWVSHFERSGAVDIGGRRRIGLDTAIDLYVVPGNDDSRNFVRNGLITELENYYYEYWVPDPEFEGQE